MNYALYSPKDSSWQTSAVREDVVQKTSICSLASFCSSRWWVVYTIRTYIYAYYTQSVRGSNVCLEPQHVASRRAADLLVVLKCHPSVMQAARPPADCLAATAAALPTAQGSRMMDSEKASFLLLSWIASLQCDHIIWALARSTRSAQRDNIAQ